VLSPGHIDTPGLSELMSDEQKAEAVSHVPLGRLGTPDDMAKAAVFLASDDSAYVNGIELFADECRGSTTSLASRGHSHPIGRVN
jgi:NAD(P)-dependent dehydrogenase (short-subunit alcohol dehydrogenase family)